MSETPPSLTAQMKALVERHCRFNCDAESSCRCGQHEMYRAFLALLAAQPEPQKVCQRCEGRGWVMASEQGGSGDTAWGGSWNEPCPDCKGVAAQPEPTQKLREAATLVANSLDDVTAIGWGKTVDERLWARECSTALREALKVAAPTPSAWQPLAHEGDCNPFTARCGAKFCTFEGMNAHERECDSPPPPPADADKEPTP